MSTEILNRLSASITESRAKAQKEAKDGFAAAFRDFFKRFPEVIAIRWTQGTPSFNDGNPCTFSRHEMYFSLDPKVRPFVEEGLPLEDAIAAAQAGIAAPEASDEDEDEDEAEFDSGDNGLISTYLNPNYGAECAEYDRQSQANNKLSWGDPNRKYIRWPDRRLDRKPPTEREVALTESFDEFSTLEEDLFEYAFGDGVRVTVTAKGISTDEYYCE